MTSGWRRTGFGRAGSSPAAGTLPLLSMLRKMAEWGDPQPARLFFGVTRRDEVFAQEQLSALALTLQDFRADTVVWQPDAEWTGPVGNPVELAAAEVAMLDEMPDVYVCGPPPMVDAAHAALTAAGCLSTRFMPSDSPPSPEKVGLTSVPIAMTCPRLTGILEVTAKAEETS